MGVSTRLARNAAHPVDGRGETVWTQSNGPVRWVVGLRGAWRTALSSGGRLETSSGSGFAGRARPTPLPRSQRPFDPTAGL